MSRSSHNLQSLSVKRTSSFVMNGTTTFTVKGLGICPNGGGNKFFTLCIPVSGVSCRQVLSELSLLTSDCSIAVEFDGTIADDGFVTVETLRTLKVHHHHYR